jgi:hypothetical protein
MTADSRCPTCRQPVEAIVPIIEVGRTFQEGDLPIFYKDGDRTIGHTLKPCGHDVEWVEWSAEGGYLLHLTRPPEATP